MRVKNSEMLATVARPEQYPEEGPPEIALAGRSNVGKSSLINTLVNRKKLARTSGQPGKTQTLNFYGVNNQTFRFVDLPGYGYARVSKKEREKWGKMIDTYLNSRTTLKEVFLLLDIRHKPGEHDKMMYQWILDMGFTGYIVATKADKLSKNQQEKQISVIKKELDVPDRKMIFKFSALKKQGMAPIWNLIDDIIDYQEEEIEEEK